MSEYDWKKANEAAKRGEAVPKQQPGQSAQSYQDSVAGAAAAKKQNG